MERLNIEKDGLEFKNLLSGPAPVGRILNYIYTAGTVGMFHKNGYRSLDFKNNVGSAWATEFIIGLGIFSLGAEIGDKYQLLLTPKGKKLFEIMKAGNYSKFDEGSNLNSIENVKIQMKHCSKDLEAEFKSVFVESYPFRILKQFTEENGYMYQDRTVFMDDLFEAVKNLYDTDPTPYNRDARTPTAKNRVPSLLQLCQLFGMLDDSDGIIQFAKKEIEKAGNGIIEYTKADIDKAVASDFLLAADAEALAAKFGIDGTVLVESVVRNSTLQHIFKYNLLVSQHSKCVMCGLENKELLVGSHIKPASESDAGEKADFNNGLLLCCNHDKLFDRYLITFNFLDGQIEISKTISEDDMKILGINPDYKLPEELLTPERMQYLTEHNIEFRKREDER